MRPLEDHRVVKLCVARKAKFSPSADEQLADIGGTDGRTRRTRCETAVDRDTGEDCELDSASKNKTFNGVERVEFAACGSDRRKVPTDRRGRTADPTSPIQKASALQNPADGPSRGNGVDVLRDHRPADRVRSRVSEIAFGQLPTQPQHVLLDCDARAVDRLWRTRRPVIPVDSIKPLAAGAFNPPLNGPKTHPKLAGDPTQRAAALHRPHHRTTLFCDGFLISGLVSLFLSAYQAALPPREPGYGI